MNISLITNTFLGEMVVECLFQFRSGSAELQCPMLGDENEMKQKKEFEAYMRSI